MLRKTSAAAAVLGLVTAGSALFGGAALAGVTNTGGPGGAGGAATNNCLNVAAQIPVLNIISDPANSASCTAVGGEGGAGGAGANF